MKLLNHDMVLTLFLGGAIIQIIACCLGRWQAKGVIRGPLLQKDVSRSLEEWTGIVPNGF